MERNRRWYSRAVAEVHKLIKNNLAQGTVEYAIVLVAFLAIVIAFGFLWNALSDGLFVEHAVQSASHHVQSGLAGVLADVFVY